ncbi:MAG TPA: hypothetical protein HPP58_08825 [Deltaproteobacteria bacterium]|nr:hypothetical protein [Deltaproteobacteria bacterium]
MEVIERAKAIDYFGCILKPFNEGQVRAAIGIALHKKESEAQLTEERNKTVRGSLLSSPLPEQLSTLTPGSDIEIVCQPGNHYVATLENRLPGCLASCDEQCSKR